MKRERREQLEQQEHGSFEDVLGASESSYSSGVPYLNTHQAPIMT
jgi:hypothetical protein